MARKLAANMPPITVKPITWREAAPAPLALASGTQPKINAKLVIKIGRSRNLAASNAASKIGLPSSTPRFANSTIKIAFFALKPINITKPICAYTLFSKRPTIKPANAPNTAMGVQSRTLNGSDQLSYCAARIRKTQNNECQKSPWAKRLVAPVVPDSSCRDNQNPFHSAWFAQKHLPALSSPAPN